MSSEGFLSDHWCTDERRSRDWLRGLRRRHSADAPELSGHLHADRPRGSGTGSSSKKRSTTGPTMTLSEPVFGPAEGQDSQQINYSSRHGPTGAGSPEHACRTLSSILCGSSTAYQDAPPFPQHVRGKRDIVHSVRARHRRWRRGTVKDVQPGARLVVSSSAWSVARPAAERGMPFDQPRGRGPGPLYSDRQ